MELKNYELEKIEGGSVTSAFINAVVNAFNLIYDYGKYAGSAVRRLTNDTYCPMR